MHKRPLSFFPFTVLKSSALLFPDEPLCSQEAAWYLRRHKQELELLLIGSGTMGVEFNEGVMELGILPDLLYFYV